MILARVNGQVVATIKHSSYVGRRLLLLDRLNADGTANGEYLVAVDSVSARVGQTVIVVDEGNSARQVTGDPNAPLRSVVVGIVDELDLTAPDAPLAPKSKPFNAKTQRRKGSS
jgi:ethanolamine utilization protein EutN